MKKILIAVSVVALALSTQAANLDKGTYEARFDGSADFDTANDTRIEGDIGLGVFVADNFEVGGLIGGLKDDLVSLVRVGGLAEYNFDMGNPLVPFVGATLAWAFSDVDTPGGDEDNDAGELTGLGGVKYFITEDLAIAAQGEIRIASDDIYPEEDGDIEDTEWLITWGLRYYFDL